MVLREALSKLDHEAAHDSAHQRVVKVLVGTCFLTTSQAEAALQPLQPDNPDAFNVWHVHDTEQTLVGVLIFVKGAHANHAISWSPFCP